MTACGYVAIIGRPNVGKSTILNYILGKKLSITSRKPQTTQQQLLGIKTADDVQTIYVDTPGVHSDSKRAINRYMNRAATSAIYDVEVIVFVVEANVWCDEDEAVLELVKESNKPVILAVNKIDKLTDKSDLLPFIDKIKEKYDFASIVPMSVKTGVKVNALEQEIISYMPQGPFLFPENQITDRDQQFLIAEVIREKIIRGTSKEVPYRSTVQIEQVETKGKVLHIHAIIWVERPGQKAIIIGKQGDNLKRIGTAARLDLEKLLSTKVFLQIWVKVKENWSDSDSSLQQLGYRE